MNKLLLIMLFVSCSLIAQDYGKNWNKVVILEKDGKIKSADEEVAGIYASAKKKNQESQIIKCFFYRAKFMHTLEENSQTKILAFLRKETDAASIPTKAIFNLIYGKCLDEYYTVHQYQLYNRAKPIQLRREISLRGMQPIFGMRSGELSAKSMTTNYFYKKRRCLIMKQYLIFCRLKNSKQKRSIIIY